MIIKSLTRKKPSYKKLLTYMLNGWEKSNEPFLLLHNVRGYSLEEWERSFLENDHYYQSAFGKTRRINSVYAYHFILSFPPEDTPYLDNEVLQTIAQKFINELNPNAMAIALPHLDQEHKHIHICASGIEYMGDKTLRISRRRFQEIKHQVQEFKRSLHPELSHNLVNHLTPKKGKIRALDAHYYAQKKGHTSEIDQLREQVSQTVIQSLSEVDFVSRLLDEGIEVYYRKEQLTGVVLNNKKYRLSRLGVKVDFADPSRERTI